MVLVTRGKGGSQQSKSYLPQDNGGTVLKSLLKTVLQKQQQNLALEELEV
jgi:hypothetical protein